MVYYLTGPAHARCVYAYVVIYVYVKQLVRNISWIDFLFFWWESTDADRVTEESVKKSVM
jgi:hypothetical protein